MIVSASPVDATKIARCSKGPALAGNHFSDFDSLWNRYFQVLPPRQIATGFCFDGILSKFSLRRLRTLLVEAATKFSI